MRGLALTIAAMVMAASSAYAGPLAPVSEESGLLSRGTTAGPVAVGDTVTIGSIIPNFGVSEFEGVTAVADLVDLVIDVGDGTLNNGTQLSMTYDRAGVLVPAFLPNASETGTLVATITSTTLAEVESQVTGAITQFIWRMSGTLLFSDGGGVYDDDIVGSWNLLSVFAADNDLITVTLAVGTGESAIITTTPEPAIVGLIGAGCWALGSRHVAGPNSLS